MPIMQQTTLMPTSSDPPIDFAGPSWLGTANQMMWNPDPQDTAHFDMPLLPSNSVSNLPVEGFESLESFLALDPAFPNPFGADNSPIANQSNASSGHGVLAPSKRVKPRVPYFRFL